MDTEVQLVSNEAGEPTAVIVPIMLWREIESERETAYLLKPSAMLSRLLEAKQRHGGMPLRMSLRSLEFDAAAFEDLVWWVDQDRVQAQRILRIIREISRDPFKGIGKPEPLSTN